MYATRPNTCIVSVHIKDGLASISMHYYTIAGQTEKVKPRGVTTIEA